MLNQPAPYRGRFAPSPSGPLHLGSLVAALGSYLDARANHGTWLLRIEDIDPPREVPGASSVILRQLEAHGLCWDETEQYQSQHYARYQQHITELNRQGLVYACDCSRKTIKARGPHYTGFCRQRGLDWANKALRLVNQQPVTHFHDLAHGEVTADTGWSSEDFILKRRDGLWAYQLAVVSDDRAEGITHIVRGSDLLTASLWQLTLWQTLNQCQFDAVVALPQLRHLPLIVGPEGRKLSKQNHAPAIDANHAAHNISIALQALGLKLPPELAQAPVAEQLAWAIDAWRQQQRASEPGHVDNFTV